MNIVNIRRITISTIIIIFRESMDKRPTHRPFYTNYQQ